MANREKNTDDLSRRILALVTTGGITHATPVFEICRTLADRGHTIEFATCAGQEFWTDDYPFIKTTYAFGPPPTEEQIRAHYERMVRLNVATDGLGPMMKSKYVWDSCWPDTYNRLKGLCLDPTTRPDLIIADFFAEVAAKDMMVELNIPIAIVWPQMPFLLAPVPYIPGLPGFQVDMTLTSEHASLWSRLRNELVVVRGLPYLIPWLWWTKRMRRKFGVIHRIPSDPKPNYLVLVNSFFGLEVPQDLPPLMAVVGPLLADTYPPLDEGHAKFLETHDRTIYVSPGSHVVLPEETLLKMLGGLLRSLDAGHINGVIWSMGQSTRQSLDRTRRLTRADGNLVTLGDFVDEKLPEFLLTTFAPQRATLDHPNTKLFLTHGGGSSVNEALYHGKPVLTLAFFFDQICNSARLSQAGVGLSLDKYNFAAEEVDRDVRLILDDAEGLFSRNVERMKRIARIASRRKHLAADLVEEVLYDHELRFRDGKAMRPMHLQTADMRMPWYKARNLDLWAFALGCLGVLPAVSMYWVGKLIWTSRVSILEIIKEVSTSVFRVCQI